MYLEKWPYRPLILLKRDGSEVPFDASKIERAIAAAGEASGQFGVSEARALTEAVLARLLEYRTLDVEQVQDRVERVLMEAGYYETARAYIVYRERHGRLRRDRKQLIDVAASMNEYLSREDWRVQANANQGYSLGGLILNVSGKVTANYWLDEVYGPEIGRAHREADLHIHDLDMLAGYCAGWSLRSLLNEGLNGVPGRVEAGAPRHLSSALGQMVNFLGTLQNEWAGAQAFSSFDTYLAPYVRQDSLDYAQVRQALQEFIYNLNVPSRWGTQTPFTNLTFDWVCPEDLREQVPVIAGQEMPFCYGDLQAEMDLINRAYIEVMMAGDAKGRVFTFPIPTYNITHDFPWDSYNATRLFDMTARYGLPYFQNFLNSDMQPNQVRSMCCRLQLDVRELLKRGNGLFGSAEQTGSLGVVTLNCARLGYRHRQDLPGLLQRLDELLDLAYESLEVKRKVIQHHMDAGLYPYTRRYLGTLRNHFSTIGVNGLHEMLRNFSDDRDGMHTQDGLELALQVLDHVRSRLVTFQERSGHLYNLEATPAEGTTYRFAKEDLKRCPGILQAGTPEAPYYTNSSQLPVGFTDDPFEALALQDALQCKYTGGTVLHLYMAERISSAQACKQLVRTALSRFRLPYLTVTPTFSICPVHGYLAGEHEFCPKCDEALLLEHACCGACGG
ncbi:MULTISPECIES: ribonucleoside triphosphate reductase [Pseudomonadaceae]|uniref:Ribonucleoside triphosphate reductase n=1 Tax=Metapseudomonas otitidis TaxID=319939 RepID=A0ABU3Y0B4_9GAMM|nr:MULTISPECIES: ribonucleoside triphosphate reductase [Pseudomonas]MDH0335274.1 ribonucleoside triphosphate reductase [Pseudomonas otitidis]MDH1105182.1 ribonucleoside triphosphate reductase [Pseudomonas otitidis]MDH1157447.1 ribonucleoside triphosphate reductase [Pseudomonas otitidis]MDH1162952.1 ribonucleoside triphosphate reductase [Pseudomonas otitidis]MDU9397157.1 ribonucleoside triphosphate reductase [Pseudomonas sp. zfem003]